jgi:molybdopterin-containing oxidoreductase family membrane subunit
MVYHPTIIETAITMGTILLAVIIITVLFKLFPVISIWEMAEEQSENDNDKFREKDITKNI